MSNAPKLLAPHVDAQESATPRPEPKSTPLLRRTPLAKDDPILRARAEIQNAQDMHQEAMALLLEIIAALSPTLPLDEAAKTRRARARARLMELADLMPSLHRTMGSSITMLYAAERKHEGLPPVGA